MLEASPADVADDVVGEGVCQVGLERLNGALTAHQRSTNKADECNLHPHANTPYEHASKEMDALSDFTPCKAGLHKNNTSAWRVVHAVA